MRSKLLTSLISAGLLLLGMATSFAQTKTVRGTVIGEDDGQPVVGAFVTVEGASKIGTLTDLDGNFELKNVPQSAKNLVVSFMGYQDEKVPVADNVKVTLKTDNELPGRPRRRCFRAERVRYIRYGS